MARVVRFNSQRFTARDPRDISPMLHSHRLNLKCSLAFREIPLRWEWNCSVNEYHLPINRARLTQTNSIHCCQKKKRVKDLIIESSQIQLLRRLQPRHSKIQIKHFSTSSREQLKYPLKHSRQLTRLTRWHFPQWRNFELINFIHSRNLFGLRLYRVRLNVEKMQSCWLKFQFFARSQRKTLRNHIKHFSYCHLSNCSLFRNHVFGFN